MSSSIRGKSTAIPATPRVISPSPTPSDSEASARDYLGPTTRSAARKRLATPQPVEVLLDEDDETAASGLRRSRTRSRSPIDSRKLGKLTSRTPAKATASTTNGHAKAPAALPLTNGHTPESSSAAAAKTKEANGNNLLSPPPPATPSSLYYGGWSWRDFSRSPSPLGLIPIHRRWRAFVHKHEVPRKALHVSIGFFVVWLYLSGTQTSAVCPYLMGALVPIAAADLLRHHHAPFNRFYVRVLGALMRESEFDGYNGVIYYLLGAWIVLWFFPKDVGVMGTLLLSWCDTAASTFGRAYGRYTPRIRRGKSLAGSFAAFLVGVGTAAWFWGWLAPTKGPFVGDEGFMFTGTLGLPTVLARAVVDLFGWDDNLTIPVLSGLGIWGFLKVFG
ncbi:hypothetical protein B0T17DRAFT_622999 [Bombardia bombarda]|uniref:Phosphatidate cytidylyltransferase n=1 Tax=Bombardia bombarda TaxID=252184 RepID=A0AA39XIX0_9PEZI|nr:hypothetical protein B0T17DRAFT_622999 [Bombardia bombarda]